MNAARLLSGLIVLTMSSGGLSQRRESSPALRAAFYYPIQWRTYEAMNEASVRKTFDVSSALRGRSKEIFKIVTDTSGQVGTKFSATTVRLVLDFGSKGVYLMDRFGIISHKGASVALTPDRYKELRIILTDCLPPPPPITIEPDVSADRNGNGPRI